MKLYSFRKKCLTFSLLTSLIVSTPGCIYLVVGGVGALGGYVVSPDTVEGLTETPSDDIWIAAVDILSIMGLIMEQDEEAGLITAKVHGAKVDVKIIQVSPSMVKIVVKARKAYLPRVSLAQDIYAKIMGQVSG